MNCFTERKASKISFEMENNLKIGIISLNIEGKSLSNYYNSQAEGACQGICPEGT